VWRLLKNLSAKLAISWRPWVSHRERVMRMWHYGVMVLAVALTVSVAGHTSQPGDGKDQAQDPFAGKVVLVSTANSQNLLKNVQVRKLGERSFLVGVTVREDSLTREQFPGRPLWLPVSDVVEIVEFDDLGQIRKLGNSRQESERERR
jgi:hypothetical protein